MKGNFTKTLLKQEIAADSCNSLVLSKYISKEGSIKFRYGGDSEAKE